MTTRNKGHGLASLAVLVLASIGVIAVPGLTSAAYAAQSCPARPGSGTSVCSEYGAPSYQITNHSGPSSCGPYERMETYESYNCSDYDIYFPPDMKTCRTTYYGTEYRSCVYTGSYSTLEYDANNGSGAPGSSAERSYGQSVTFTISSTKPTRKGYTFLGWDTDSKATKPDFPKGNTGPISVGDGQTVTLYAVWQKAGENPVIKGADDVTISTNDVPSWSPRQGVTASDKEDGDLTSKIQVRDKPAGMESKPGRYTFTYKVTDSDGNTVTVNRVVTVEQGATLHAAMPATGSSDGIVLGGGVLLLVASAFATSNMGRRRMLD